jgi:hypothetical protein
MNTPPSRDTLRKRKERANETSEQLDLRRARDRERKRMKRAAETPEQRQLRLSRQRERYRQRKATVVSGPSNAQHDRVTRHNDSSVNRLDESPENLRDDSRVTRHDASLLNPLQNTVDIDNRLSESDRDLLHAFHTNVNAFSNILCHVCNERFPYTELRDVCRRCCKDKNDIKKFSAANNMDPGDLPDDLKDLKKC